jgi:gas vesicle protein
MEAVMEQHHEEHFSASGSGWRVMFGLLAGAAIGTGIGILVAPARGSDLRRRLAESATNVPKGLARVGRTALEESRHVLEREAKAIRRAS